MKKFVVILAAFVLALFVVSCGGGSDNGETSSNTDTTDKTDTDTGNHDNSDSGSNTEEPEGDTGENTETNDNDTADNGANNQQSEDNTDTGSEEPEEKPCTEGDIRVGDTTCPDNPKGKIHQKCENGGWVDIEGTCTLCDPGDYPKVCGTYAQKMWFTSSSKVAGIDLAEGWTRTYFHIVQEQEQDKVHIKATYCNIKIDNSMSGKLQVVMPQSFADALGTANKEVVISKRDDGTFDFAQDVFWEIRGIDPACYEDNPAGYTLPKDKDDRCVQDWDEDGNPGLTVRAKGSIGGNSTMYMVEKSSSTMHDGLISEDGLKIIALVDWTDEQNILYAENPLLQGGSDNKQKNSSSKPEFVGNFFNFIEQFKIPEGSDCAYIVDNAATIFSPDPMQLK